MHARTSGGSEIFVVELSGFGSCCELEIPIFACAHAVEEEQAKRLQGQDLMGF